jgi:hypothetical protein
VKASKAREQMLVVLLMEGANKGFRPLLHDLENNHALGANLYPETVVDALQVMMVHEAQPVYKQIMKNVSRWKKKEKEQVEVPEFRFMMSKAEMIKKGLCFNVESKDTRPMSARTTKKEPRVEMMNMEMDSNTCRHKSIPFLGSTKALKILDKEQMLV